VIDKFKPDEKAGLDTKINSSFSSDLLKKGI
jgi:hypothetical protein